MDRLTRPNIDTDQTTVRFMDAEVKIQGIGDKLLELILNGPTINGIKKDTLRHMVRQLYAELKRYEDLDMTPEDIDQTMLNFSSFLMEMTGGRMSKTNYTVQAMVAEANDYQQRECDECADRQELERVMAELDQVEQERDAAIASIRKIAECGTTWMCPYCKNAKRIYSGCCDCALGGVCKMPFTKFEWRGGKLEDSYYGQNHIENAQRPSHRAD